MRWLKITIPVVTAGIMSAAAFAYDTATATVATQGSLAAALVTAQAGQKTAEAAAPLMPMSTIILVGAGALAIWYFNKK